MSTKTLGRLQKLELREAWTSESGDFTPWLAKEENLNLLGEAIANPPVSVTFTTNHKKSGFHNPLSPIKTFWSVS